jgi:hypothetical protein
MFMLCGLVVSMLASGTPSSRVQTRPKPSDFSGERILNMPSFGGEVKQFAACKRSLNGVKRRHFGKVTGKHSRPQFHLSLLGAFALLGTWRHLTAEVGTSKGGGKVMENYP